jgi:hypothetical protein
MAQTLNFGIRWSGTYAWLCSYDESCDLTSCDIKARLAREQCYGRKRAMRLAYDTLPSDDELRRIWALEGTYDPEDRAMQKQRWRQSDALALASGAKTVEQLTRENSFLSPEVIRLTRVDYSRMAF